MNEMVTIDWSVILPLFLISGVLVVLAILDWIKQGDNVRGNRWVWFVIILFVSTFGPILYFIFGRRRR